jgi:pimeloyl-ACP methyl ester carboxylesterase
MLAGCGHAPHAEQPETVLETMARFIARLDRYRTYTSP